MQSLLYFLLVAGLFIAMMRFGCGAHVMGHGHSHRDRRLPAAAPDAAGISPEAKAHRHEGASS